MVLDKKSKKRKVSRNMVGGDIGMPPGFGRQGMGMPHDSGRRQGTEALPTGPLALDTVKLLTAASTPAEIQGVSTDVVEQLVSYKNKLDNIVKRIGVTGTFEQPKGVADMLQKLSIPYDSKEGVADPSITKAEVSLARSIATSLAW